MSCLKAVSYNAGKTLGEFDSFMYWAERAEEVFEWSIGAFFEFDGKLTGSVLPEVIDMGTCRVWRHYPGPGSYSMAFAVRAPLVSCIRNIKGHGRAMSAHFVSPSINLHILLWRGAHGQELQAS